MRDKRLIVLFSIQTPEKLIEIKSTMFKATLTAIVFILSCVSGKPVTSQNDDFIFENFDFDGISTVRDQGPGLVGIITPLLRKPVYIPDDYDESVCPELPEAGCESVRLMTFYGIECAYCVIKEGLLSLVCWQ